MKNFVILALLCALIATVLAYHRLLYRFSVEIAVGYCEQAVLRRINLPESYEGRLCELTHHDISMELQVVHEVGGIMECDQIYGFWGPSLPLDCQFVVRPR